jgi:hypothetical protein
MEWRNCEISSVHRSFELEVSFIIRFSPPMMLVVEIYIIKWNGKRNEHCLRNKKNFAVEPIKNLKE